MHACTGRYIVTISSTRNEQSMPSCLTWPRLVFESEVMYGLTEGRVRWEKTIQRHQECPIMYAAGEQLESIVVEAFGKPDRHEKRRGMKK